MPDKQAHEQNGLKIIGAGFGRTGTLSLKSALEELGFSPCYHMVELFQRPEDLPRWEAAAAGEPVDWSAIFVQYQAAVDWPSCAFYAELMQAYPDAKVLLTVRDPDSWYESVRSTIYPVSRGAGGSPFSLLVAAVMRILMSSMRQRMRIVNDLVWDQTFGGKFEDKRYAIAVFNEHNEEVKRKVPPEKLLVYNVKEGWEPLCAFLGVPVPENKPFPRLNDRISFTGNSRRRKAERIARVLLVSVSSILLATILFFLQRRRK